MNRITLGELVLLPERVIPATGGIHGILNPGGIESALGRPFAPFGGDELFPDLTHKVAALIHSIITPPPFVDENKRTALLLDSRLKLAGMTAG